MTSSTAPDERLDREFWSVVAGLALISLAVDVVIARWDIGYFLAEASSAAVQLDTLFKGVIVVAAPILIFVAGIVVYFTFRYRLRPSDAPLATGSTVESNARLERIWFAVPTLLLIGLAAVSSIGIGSYYGAIAGPAVEIVGHNWYYEFRYAGLPVPIDDELVLPVGADVTLYLTSAESDASLGLPHSFWVPEFRIKQDVYPGRVVSLHVRATRIGIYPVVCTVFCGIGHPAMRARVAVLSRRDFERWFHSKTSSSRGVAR